MLTLKTNLVFIVYSNSLYKAFWILKMGQKPVKKFGFNELNI